MLGDDKPPELTKLAMPHLKDPQLADLLEELGSTIELKLPASDSLRRIAKQQRGCLAEVASKLLTALEQGETLESCFEKLELADGSQVAAAIRGAEKTGTPELLYRLAELLRSRDELKNTIRLNWFYPCLLCIIAYILFVTSLAPLVRENNNVIALWPTATVQTSAWIYTYWWLPPCIVTVLVAASVSMLYKPRRLPASLSRHLFYSALASQLEGNVPENEAIRTAAMMAKEDELLQTTNASFSTPRVRELLQRERSHSMVSQAFELDSNHTEREGPRSDSEAKLIRRAHLRQLAFACESKFRRREVLLHRIIPSLVSFGLGILFILTLVALFIAPIYREVSPL